LRATSQELTGTDVPRLSARRVGYGLLIASGLIVLATVATTRWGDRSLWPPVPHAPTVTVFVVSHGYHAGIVLPRAALAEQERRQGLGGLGVLAARFTEYEQLEIGWGDESFYRAVPTAESLTVGLALRALFLPGNPSVLHVVGVKSDPRAMFVHSDIVRIELLEAGFDRLAGELAATIAPDPSGQPEDLGPGLYGPSLFFRANGSFHLLNVCNHWIARLLDAAGVPTAPVLATLPQGLLLDLKWRSGLVRLAPPAS
jgi:uncharacterized protein (TIGR02117 family)